MTSYLLDTNHLGVAVKRGSSVGARISEAKLQGHRFGTCLPVLCELEAGIRQVAHPRRYRQNLNLLLAQIRIWPMDASTTVIFGNIHEELRKAGQMMSVVDIMIAAIGRQMNLVILTTDQDFDLLPDLHTEDWTT